MHSGDVCLAIRRITVTALDSICHSGTIYYPTSKWNFLRNVISLSDAS